MSKAKPRKEDPGEVLARIEAALAALAERVERLEGRGAPAAPAPAEAARPEAGKPEEAPAAAKAPAPPPAVAADGITEEELLAVSAALAAYLGVRVRIRQIRLVSSAAWAQQGRVSIQASHHLHS